METHLHRRKLPSKKYTRNTIAECDSEVMSTSYQILLFLAIFCCPNVRCQMKSMVWSKRQREFVPLDSIPEFAALENDTYLNSLSLETHNFGGQKIRVSYYEELNIAMFNEDNTRISGICGEIWYLLADYMNFTLVPVKYAERNFGVRLENDSYSGLMGLLQRKEIDVILRTGLYVFRMGVVDYTTPIWKTSYRLIIRPEYTYDNLWILTMFSKWTWYCILFLFSILTLSGFCLQKVSQRHAKTKKSVIQIIDPNDRTFTFGDHIFYTFAIICAQGYIPETFLNKFKILSVSKSFFAWLILLAFSAHLIYRMTNRILSPPFKDIPDLLNNTDYVMLAFSGSMIHENFMKRLESRFRSLDNYGEERIHFLDSPNEMYRKVCYSRKKYALFEVEDRYMAWDRYICQLIPVGRKYYNAMIGFAVLKDFPYKKAINAGIVKLHEVGLVDALRDRWLNARIDRRNNKKFKTIDLHQVYLILLILCMGIILSLIILTIENILFFYEKTLKK